MKSLLVLIVCLTAIGCQQPKELKTETMPTSTPASRPETISEQTIEILVQGGKTIKATVKGNEAGKYSAIFQEPVQKTDGNLYAIALQILPKFFGKNRGLIQMESVHVGDFRDGKYFCWAIENPNQEFCISHIEVSEKDKRIGGVMFFVR